MSRWPRSVGGRGTRPDAGGTPRAGAALKLHEAPDLGAVHADIGLDVGGQLADGGQVDAEQFSAVLQRCRNRPAQVRVVPGPHRSSVSNACSKLNRECYLLHSDRPPGTVIKEQRLRAVTEGDVLRFQPDQDGRFVRVVIDPDGRASPTPGWRLSRRPSKAQHRVRASEPGRGSCPDSVGSAH
jgi:hypothetical protein